jgi:lycopene cyclase domain-containing protein
MTYFNFLFYFLVIPIFLMIALILIDQSRDAIELREWPIAIAVHVVLALAYTPIWDNYLVATGVWFYHPKLVTGILLGYVPLEEYTFFVLQTILTGLFWVWLAKRIVANHEFQESHTPRIIALILLGIFWIGSIMILVLNWRPGTYLGLILVWALPPIALQIFYGADILWHRRRFLAVITAMVTIYLCVADSIAISSGTWTIAPQQSTGIFIGALPVEEFIFFLVTNLLIVFGITLLLVNESRARAMEWRQRIAVILGNH